MAVADDARDAARPSGTIAVRTRTRALGADGAAGRAAGRPGVRAGAQAGARGGVAREAVARRRAGGAVRPLSRIPPRLAGALAARPVGERRPAAGRARSLAALVVAAPARTPAGGSRRASLRPVRAPARVRRRLGAARTRRVAHRAVRPHRPLAGAVRALRAAVGVDRRGAVRARSVPRALDRHARFAAARRDPRAAARCRLAVRGRADAARQLGKGAARLRRASAVAR